MGCAAQSAPRPREHPIVHTAPAQACGLLESSVKALDSDCYDASSHERLGLPAGTEVLWMRRAYVDTQWPLFPPVTGPKGVGRFKWIDTASAYVIAASLPAQAPHRSAGLTHRRRRAIALQTTVRRLMVMDVLPMMQPRMPIPIAPPGFFMSNLGMIGIMALVMLHAIYGAIVGAICGPVREPLPNPASGRPFASV